MSARESGAARASATAAFSFWAPVSVRYSDMDEQGHVNNAVFFTYFEQGRIGYFDAVRRLGREAQSEAAAADSVPGRRTVRVGPAATDDRLELPLVVSEASCSYRRPISSLAPISVGVRTARLGRASMVLEYAVCDAPHGQVYAMGSTTIVCVDLVSGRPRGLPDWTLAAVRQLEPELKP